MKKKIVIIGGGISGLSVLHYLKVQHLNRNDVDIRLFEKNTYCGGTIRTIRDSQMFFESGPNGFLNNKPRTLRLIDELNLKNEVVSSRESARKRYIKKHGRLYPVPMNPKELIFGSLLDPLSRLRVLQEKFIKPGSDENESIYDFGKRRFGEKFTQTFIEPFVSGVFAGNAKELNLRYSFPDIFRMEKEHGSLIKAMIQKKKEKRQESAEDECPGKPQMLSFKQGMATLTDALGNRHKDNIDLGSEITAITDEFDQMVIHTKTGHITADELYMCVPAYGAATLLGNLSERLAEPLGEIRYAPVAVVGLTYRDAAFAGRPEGFGYLIPPTENSEILGVLFESDVFPNRASSGHTTLRVMIGGMRQPQSVSHSEEELIRLAHEEVAKTLKAVEEPQKAIVYIWSKAIPQYDSIYTKQLQIIPKENEKLPNLQLVANYLNGISLNDCIENAYHAANQSHV